MTLGLLHQVGHNAVWNIDSFQNEGCGDGLILSPLHQAQPTVKNLLQDTRSASIFDPQFYLPNSRKTKLLSYAFFPEQVEGGFQTGSYAEHAAQVASACVEFQIQQGFRKVVIPTRFLDEMYPEYFDMQGEFSVNSFIEAAGRRPLCLSLAVKASMIRHASWRKMLLDWITSFHQVDELYLMYEHVRDTKQIQDPEFIREALRFFREVLNTGLKLTIGYTNTEGLLYSTVGDPNIGEDSRGVLVMTCHAMAMRLVGASFAKRSDTGQADVFQRVLLDAIALLKGEDLPPDEADEQRDRLLAGFRRILVDEYQDIGLEQYELIAALAGRNRRDEEGRNTLFAVGDDDQNIYAFAGASVKFIRQFEADYEARPTFLIENYRSTAHIVGASNAVIAPGIGRMKVDHPIAVNRTLQETFQ